MGRIDAFERIAADLDVRRFKGEDDLTFCSRVAYSGARYWVSAFCMDDGDGGQRGVTPQVLGSRLGRWLNSLNAIMPGIAERLEIGEGGARAIYGRMADAGDILQAGECGRYRALTPRLRPITDGAALALGFFEPATEIFPGRVIAGGVSTLVLGHFEEPERRSPWWETDLSYMTWIPASDYGELRYLNPEVNRWGIHHPDSWTGREPFGQGLSLARCEDAPGEAAIFLAVRKTGKRTLASRISNKAAQEFMNRIKNGAGKPVLIEFERVDSVHLKAFLPITVLPSQVAAVVDALSWPSSIMDIGNYRLFRKESVGEVRRLLEEYDIATRGPRIGGGIDARRK